VLGVGMGGEGTFVCFYVGPPIPTPFDVRVHWRFLLPLIIGRVRRLPPIRILRTAPDK
jgi:hypothetical protein